MFYKIIYDVLNDTSLTGDQFVLVLEKSRVYFR